MSARLELGNGEAIELAEAAMKSGAGPVATQRADDPVYAWITDRWARAVPVLACHHLALGDPVHWFPSFASVQFCQACGSRIRAALESSPSPVNECAVCQENIPPGAWGTTLAYESPLWSSTVLCCEACVQVMGFLPAGVMVSEGIAELEDWANRGRGEVTGG
jgi:hypothetical protein